MARAQKKYDERDETQRARDAALEATLRNERSSWETDLRDLDDYIKPGRLRLQTSETNKGNKRATKIINNTGTIAHRTARSGLHSGMSSPARPWIMIESPDPDLNDYGPVKEWNHTVTSRMLRLFGISNIYNGLPMVYGDELQFGGGILFVDEDEDDFFRCYVPPPGSYWIAVGARLVVDTYLRELSLTVRQVVERYGDKKAGPGARWEPFSQTIKDLYERGNLEERVDVMQLIVPNARWDSKQYEAKFKRFRSCHYEKGGDDAKYLRESGYDEFPVMGPRWDVNGEDIYGRGPGMDALGDIKGLQILERRKLNAIDKMINPPLVGPAALANRKVSLLSGDLLAFDTRTGMEGIKPIHEVRLPIEHVAGEIREHERRINGAFYADLFLMLTQLDRRQITAREIDERHEEKLLMLGPVLERQNDELFDPLVDRVFAMMERRGLIPEPPPELSEMPLKVEYTSIMAQAQKLIGSIGLERFSGYVGNLLGAFPEAADKVDIDEAIDEYGNQQGVGPKIIRSNEKANERRAARQKQQQSALAMEQASQLAQGAKTLSEADLSTPSALTALATGLPA